MNHIHFIGVGGIGMSGIARLLAKRGYRVSGSDRAASPMTESLMGDGVEVHVGHDARHVGSADVVVVSTAISETNPELAEARRRGIVVRHRSEMIGEVTEGRQTIAIGGTHGKTTTSGIVAMVLDGCGFSGGFLVGGVVNQAGTNARLDSGPLFTVEADESDGSFLNYPARYRIITNIDRDHLDHHGSFEGVQQSFREFATQDVGGHDVIACGDDPGVRDILETIRGAEHAAVTTYGFEDGADALISAFTETDGTIRFALSVRGRDLGGFTVPLIGRHNALNAAAAIVIADIVGGDVDDIRRSLAAFEGVDRRFTVVGTERDIVAAHDYAHHPTEIRATLSAVRGGYDRRLIAVFQPHRFTRTRDHIDEFAASFASADTLFVLPIYAASEEPIEGITGEWLAERAARDLDDVRFVASEDELLDALVELTRARDIVVFVGAGDVYRAADRLLDRLRDG
jgi:UDP-N-acetylmuramate--alanine ligase